MQEQRQPDSYRWLSRKLIAFALGFALLPLLAAGWGLNLRHTHLARQRILESVHGRLERQRQSLELFLEDRRARLQLLAQTHELAELADQAALARAFEIFNREQWSISDLGVIDQDGRHLAYVGPYDLLDKNYAEAPWFAEVMREGVYISDMFLGFRNEPHFILAVRRDEGQRSWILRATVDTAFFRRLIANLWSGRSGDVFLVDRRGVYQTAPRFQGKPLGESGLALPAPASGPVVEIVPAGRDAGGVAQPRRVRGEIWLQEPPWLLVSQQDHDEVFADVERAARSTLLLLHLAALALLAVASFISHRLIALVRRRDRQAEELNRQLVQAGKLASLGELAAGVAHEINNPLAIILTEKQILQDDLQRGAVAEPGWPDQLRASLEQVEIQIRRCQRITHSLLRFARRTVSALEPLDLNRFLRELVELLEREAASTGVRFVLELDPDLPAIVSDASQLQQVFLNLLNNAVDAHAGKPYGTVTLRTSRAPATGAAAGPAAAGVLVEVEDTGTGIAPEHLERIFDPFFTTKAPGKGTGLGLSIGYSIVRSLGGTLAVRSEPGGGACFEVRLPPEPPAALREAGRRAEATGSGVPEAGARPAPPAPRPQEVRR